MSDTAHAGQPTQNAEIDEQTRRDFLLWSTIAVGAAGAALAVWPFIDQMNPAADTLALASTEVDLSKIDVGQSITVMWRGKPVFIRPPYRRRNCRGERCRHGSAARPGKGCCTRPAAGMADHGRCLHALGLHPAWPKDGDAKGDYGGWFCPCHGSHYDTSGRIRKGRHPLTCRCRPTNSCPTRKSRSAEAETDEQS